MPEPTIDFITSELRQWILDRTGSDVDSGLNFIEAAGLDSFDVMQLVVFLEGRFEFQFSAEDFADPGFLILGRLAALVQSRMASSGSNP